AVICMGISEALRRKLAYRYLWKITVYATTIPFLLYGIATALNDHASLLLIGLFILSLAILIRIIVIFPRRNH
ncbi:MAG TPA: DUF1189 family protein, partial [Bacillales bacterium]|nr:DUF1189 family protein [Bacillales bacterium]